jgi:hypothetical protein
LFAASNVVCLRTPPIALPQAQSPDQERLRIDRDTDTDSVGDCEIDH